MSIQRPPEVSMEQIKDIAMKCFGLKVDETILPRELNSYEDRVFAIEGTFVDEDGRPTEESGEKYILKIYGTLGTSRRHCLENMFKIIAKCNERTSPHFKLSIPICSRGENSMGMLYELKMIDDKENIPSQSETRMVKDGVLYEKYLIRLTPYLPGSTVDVKTASNELLFECGKGAAILDNNLKDIIAPENDYERSCPWNLIYAVENLYNPYVTSMEESNRKRIALNILDEFGSTTRPRLSELPKQWIHSDLNDDNSICESNKLIGFIDIDMMTYSYRVVELAIMMAYFTMSSSTTRCVAIATHIYRGYSSVIRLADVEIDLLYNLMLVRYVQSLCIGQYTYKNEDPGNEYLLATSTSGWGILEHIVGLGKKSFVKEIRSQQSS